MSRLRTRVLIFGEAYLRQILSSYAVYYNEVRKHLALGGMVALPKFPCQSAVRRRSMICTRQLNADQIGLAANTPT
jgi:hypothetical protein